MRDGSGLSSRVGVAFFLGLLLCLAIPAGVLAQGSNSGTIVGVVTDQSGGVVVGASVTLTDTSTNSSRNTTTNDAGRYVFVNVSPSTYNISVTKEGFSVAKISNQYVKIGQQTTINVTLQVGAASQTVEVTAVAGSELQTMNATVGTTISGAQLLSLPNIGRDASTLATLQPAVTPNGSVAGAVSDQNTFQLDGGNNSNDMDGTMNIYTPSYASNGAPTGVMPTPVESIEEFKVSTNNQTADFNGSAGMQVQMATKRGSDQWHGSAYEYYFSTQFSANTWSNNRNGIKLPLTHRNRFGAAAGGEVLPSHFGGKTYFFANYEGFRFPQSTTITKTVPTALMRAGVIQVPDPSGTYQPYNLNPTAVTVAGTTYQPANVCGTSGNLPCDPRGLGLNPEISQIWKNFMPTANSTAAGDQFNTSGYVSSIGIPQSSDFGVVRLDHDFGQKWHFMASYRVYKFSQLTTNQVDIGGAISGDTFGQATALAPRPQKPSYYVAGMTTNITPNLTNDFHYDYLRNFWQWVTQAAPPQLAGLGGALEVGGESSNALIPYNVNTQNARQRFWDGQDNLFRDDLSLLHGNHLFQFGGLYQRNFNFHTRNDNGNGIMNATVYQITNGPGLDWSSNNYFPMTSVVASNQQGSWETLYSEVLGIVAQPQTLYTRSGPQLTLQPLGTPMFDQSVIPTYNLYFSDTWHMKPTFTLTYGLGYQVEMPPFEQNGKQVELVDGSGNLVVTTDYLAQRQKAALAGQVYNPTLGFATVTNVGAGLKYPYNPFYKGFSPRVSVAWAPNYDNGILGKAFGHGKSVVRLGYNRIFGRLNGVDLVLVPLLGTGLGQALQCQGALSPGAVGSGGNCQGPGTANANTAFRIGPTTTCSPTVSGQCFDGLSAPLPSVGNTLPQPYYPGVGGNAAAGDGEVLDPNFRPNVSDEVDLTIQREISSKMRVELGYIGRKIQNEYQAHDLDAVPYMTTLGGQTFAQAYANLYTEVTAGSAIQVQPFFEAAMGGASSAFCSQINKNIPNNTTIPYTSCSAAVAGTQSSNIKSTLVYSLWSALSNPNASGPGKGSWTLGRTLPSSAPGSQLSSIFMNDSLGYGNYNAAFVSFTARDWHGLSAVSNFTWSRTMGTGAVTQSTSGYSVVDPWNINAMYGPQSFDIRFLYNLTMIYQAPYFKGQQGLMGHILGGWTFAPLFTAQSGSPLGVSQGSGVNSSCQAFGEMNCSSGGTNENAVLIAPYTGGNSAHENLVLTGTKGLNTNPANKGSGINMFTNPDAVYAEFSRLVLGIDQNGGGAGPIRGLPTWNLDMTATKDIKFSERMGLMFSAQFTNVLNHFQPSTPGLNLDSPNSWGYINGQSNTPRQMEFGLRFHF